MNDMNIIYLWDDDIMPCMDEEILMWCPSGGNDQRNDHSVWGRSMEKPLSHTWFLTH